MTQSTAGPRLPIPDSEIDEWAAERIERNIDGAFDFLRAVAADPTIVDRIPNGAEIALEYASDPVLSAVNRRASLQTGRRGGHVYVHHVRDRLVLSEAVGRATPRFRLLDALRKPRRFHR